MIYIQKPDGTILTWLQKIEMFTGWGINIRWNNIFTSGNATQNMAFLIPEGVTIEPKKHYYWDYAGDVLNDADGLLKE